MPEPSYPTRGLQQWAAPLKAYIDSADDAAAARAGEFSTYTDLIRDNADFPRPDVQTWVAQGWLPSGVYPSQMLPGDRYDRIAKPPFDILASLDWAAVFSAESITGKAVGDTVDAIPDLSGYGRDLTPAEWATAQPVYRVDAKGNPYLDFPVNSAMRSAPFSVNQPYTVVAIGMIYGPSAYLISTGRTGGRAYRGGTVNGAWRFNAGASLDFGASQTNTAKRSFIGRVNSTSSDFRMGRRPEFADDAGVGYYGTGDAGSGVVSEVALGGWDGTGDRALYSAAQMEVYFAGVVAGWVSDDDIAALRKHFWDKEINA